MGSQAEELLAAGWRAVGKKAWDTLLPQEGLSIGAVVSRWLGPPGVRPVFLRNVRQMCQTAPGPSLHPTSALLPYEAVFLLHPIPRSLGSIQGKWSHLAQDLSLLDRTGEHDLFSFLFSPPWQKPGVTGALSRVVCHPGDAQAHGRWPSHLASGPGRALCRHVTRKSRLLISFVHLFSHL